MNSTWVVVADSSRARFFTARSPTTTLTEFRTLAHPEGRLHEQDMTSDLPGSQAGFDGRHHRVSGESDPKYAEADNFARTISRFLAESIDEESGYAQVIIIAAPAFLGMLREHMTPETLKRVTLELDKNLTQHDADDIRNHLPSRLPSLGS